MFAIKTLFLNHNHYHVYFWQHFGLQTFVEQLAILITHHIPAHKSYAMQMKSAHNHTFFHKVRVVNPLIIMQMCDIHFKNLKVIKMNEICSYMERYVSSINL